MIRFLGVAGVVVLCYFVLLQLYMLTLALVAGGVLYKERMLERLDNVMGFVDFSNNTGFVNEPQLWGVEVSYEFGD